MVVVRRRGENPSRVRVDAHGVGGLCTLWLINRTGGPKLDAVEDKKRGGLELIAAWVLYNHAQ